MDKFYEQLLKTKKSSLNLILTLLMYLTGFLAFISLFSAVMFFKVQILAVTVLFIGLTVITRIKKEESYKEYEYIFTNGNLQIDVIYSMKKRKTVFDMDVKNFDDFGSITDMKKDNNKIINCVPWDNQGEKYFIKASNNGKTTVIIAPDQELLKLLKAHSMISRNRN